MSEIILPESAKPTPPPDLDYHIRRLRRRAAHERNEVGDILLPSNVIMVDAADALEWAKTKLEAMERDRDELWCRALTTLEDVHMVQIVLERFNQLRPDKAAAQKEEGHALDKR